MNELGSQHQHGKIFHLELLMIPKQPKGVYQPLSMNQNALKRIYERYFAANYPKIANSGVNF